MKHVYLFARNRLKKVLLTDIDPKTSNSINIYAKSPLEYNCEGKQGRIVDCIVVLFMMFRGTIEDAETYHMKMGITVNYQKDVSWKPWTFKNVCAI